MEKSTSDNSRPLPRRSPRIGGSGPSETLMNIKRLMKCQAEQMKPQDFVRDDYEAAQNSKELIRGRTGIVYDSEMTKHYCMWDRNYPECPDRYLSILERCNELELLDRCQRVPAREVTDEELAYVHSPEHIEILKNTQNIIAYESLEELSSKFDSIFLNKFTYKCAALAAGSAIDLVDEICSDKLQNGMALIRPPGHHAMPSEYCGYCFFNNAALAARHAMKMYNLDRILIVDWDVHHGQGIQQIFYDDPRVIYFSIHRYEHGAFWPELRESNYDFVGEKSGKGFNFNVPLNTTGLKDADYIAIFQQVLMPLAYQYEPELVIVSAGYDAAIGCPEGEMEVSPACYAHMINMLMGFARGKVAVLLEGGYCLKSLAEGVALTLRNLLGDPVPSLVDFGEPSASCVDSILNVLYAQRQYWQCFQIQEQYSISAEGEKEEGGKTKKLHEIPPEKRHYPLLCYQGTGNEKRNAYETRNCYPVLRREIFQLFDEKLKRLKLMTDLTVPPNQVALAYDEGMTLHQSLSEHDHPEKPERIRSIFKTHDEFGLLHRCNLVRSRTATKKELLLVHTERHVADMEELENMPSDDLIKKASSYDSIYFHHSSYEAAALAAGCLLQVVDEVLGHRARSGVAIVRPPGHHAESDGACGFCVFNNVSLAAKYAIDRYGIKRVMILDWDVHHGNGTQRIFFDDNRVLYISLHRYNHAKFFPSSTDADFDKIGVGKGKGYNVNIPWNKPGGGMTDGDYIAAFHAVVLPIAYQYDPQLVIVSAGFDACVNDPLGNCKITPEAFGHMTHWLTSLANGKVILSLEGGYNIVSISYALTLCTKALLGDPLPPLTTVLSPSQSAIETIRKVVKAQEEYWSCLQFGKALPKDGSPAKLILKQPPAEGVDGSEIKKCNANDILAEELQKLALNPGKEKNHKFKDAHENERKGKQTRVPQRDSDPESTAGRSARPTLVGYLSENLQRLMNEEMFAVVPLPGCPHLVEVQAVPSTGINVETPCSSCGSSQENWICLICYTVHCGRYINQHMVMHNENTSHPLTLSFTDLSVWCYVCEAYIDNMVLYPAKNAAHRSKFGSDLEWSYGTREPEAESNE